MSYFTLKNGMELYYEESGSGQPVILMHGWISSHEIYSEPVEMMKDKARFIIYDHRGHGGSKGANKESVTMETLAIAIWCAINKKMHTGQQYAACSRSALKSDVHYGIITKQGMKKSK